MDWRRIYFMPHFPWTASAATVTLIYKSFSSENTLSGISGCRLKYSTVEKFWTIPTFFLIWARLSGHFQGNVFLCLSDCLWISYKWLSYQQAVTITFIFLLFLPDSKDYQSYAKPWASLWGNCRQHYWQPLWCWEQCVSHVQGPAVHLSEVSWNKPALTPSVTL